VTLGPALDPGEIRSEVGLSWSQTPHYRRLVTVALAALLPALVIGHAAWLPLAAPLVAALALASRSRRGGQVSLRVSGDRCFEDEDFTVTARIEPGDPAGAAGAELLLPPALTVDAEPSIKRHGGGAVTLTWRVTARRWGGWDTGQLRVSVRGRGGLFAGEAAVGLGTLTVFPRPPALTQLALPAELRTRIGDHVDRRAGEGVEFAGVRPFALGDKPRRINWPVSTRRGALHVNQLAAERSAEIVVVIDALDDTGQPGDTALDNSVRGAAGVARAYTRTGDRVGLITMFGPLRWMEPGSGGKQFFRIIESVVNVRRLRSFVSPDLTLLPPAALPAGVLVVLFSPLLDERAIAVALNLRERGYPVIITDTLTSEPVPSREECDRDRDLAPRLWRLERQALHFQFESVGIPVVRWPGGPRDRVSAEAGLDPAFSRYARQRVRGGAR